MKEIIQKSIQKRINYTTYRKLIVDLLKEEKSTGPSENPDYVQFSELNNTRMNRLDKTIIVLESHQNKLQNLSKKMIWLVISEGWCGDAAQILPVLNKLADCSENIDFKIVIRDENLELMDLFLTHGNRAIPMLLILDTETNELIANWGPRPQTATKMVKEYIKLHGGLDADFKISLQNWYNADKGIKIQDEVMELMDANNVF
ncbi:MAG: thioredoxin family protein [Flavobacteriaceae bacterium]|nr:thioredoxin family protein [Flavobacteriaceae bacterium]